MWPYSGHTSRGFTTTAVVVQHAAQQAEQQGPFKGAEQHLKQRPQRPHPVAAPVARHHQPQVQLWRFPQQQHQQAPNHPPTAAVLAVAMYRLRSGIALVFLNKATQAAYPVVCPPAARPVLLQAALRVLPPVAATLRLPPTNLPPPSPATTPVADHDKLVPPSSTCCAVSQGGWVRRLLVDGVSVTVTGCGKG